MTHLIKGSLEYDAQTCQIQAVFITFGALLSLGLCGGLTLFRDRPVLCGILFTSIHAGISAGILRNASIWNQLHRCLA
ncbi:hypothetical protein BJ741DRAFT_601323 [Chytriomyces cf. hyalinus JEL632]|nr:hypothetical protein BJ741DRAFT_601323 [Chytriomyces cf. hyalinus JEL632]